VKVPGRLLVQREPHGHGGRRPAPGGRRPAQLIEFVGDVIAGHGLTPFLQAAQAAGCKDRKRRPHMVEAAQDLMVEFMLQDGQR
jgi:shikimate dehydrogenase